MPRAGASSGFNAMTQELRVVLKATKQYFPLILKQVVLESGDSSATASLWGGETGSPVFHQ